MYQPLPSSKMLLAIADMIATHSGWQKFGTIAVGAIGSTPLRVSLVVGCNSPSYNETRLTAERVISSVIRNSSLYLSPLHLKYLKEPYHAEVSVVLAAKEKNYKVYGLAASRKICPHCHYLFHRYQYLLDCQPVDAWITQRGRLLAQHERENLNDLYFSETRGVLPARAPYPIL